MKYTINDIPEMVFSHAGTKYRVSDIRRKDRLCRLKAEDSSWKDNDYNLESIVKYMNDGSYQLVSVEAPSLEKNGLPEKFFIKRSPHNAEVINKWFTENTAIPRNSSGAALYYPVYRGADMKKAPDEGYVEVSWEQFRVAIGHGEIINNYSIF